MSATGNTYLEPKEWLGAISYRWLRSDRHYRGSHEEAFRQEQGTEVINDVHSVELSATYAFTKRWSMTLTLPFVHADRSSLYEHDRLHRHTMSAGGLGDLRLIGTAWLLNPENQTNQNLALSFGFKAPTGEDGATDLAHRTGGPVTRPVDQSIQPGDGGWGLVAELLAFRRLSEKTFAYVQGSYLFNPREMNGTETTTSRAGSVTFLSVPDQYLGRAGLSYTLWPEKGLVVSLGGRVEGVPVRDVFGGSDGFRRPGYAVSIEPGLALSLGKNNFSLSAPVAVHRNREQSVLDLRRSQEAGRFIQGDAAFADFFILASFSRKF